jgi:hypothetical protein
MASREPPREERDRRRPRVLGDDHLWPERPELSAELAGQPPVEPRARREEAETGMLTRAAGENAVVEHPLERRELPLEAGREGQRVARRPDEEDARVQRTASRSSDSSCS